jgi:hypothetical protein
VAYLTRPEAIRAAQGALGYLHLAHSELRKSAATPLTAHFDVFLSHSSEDAEVVAGVKALVEADGLSVYVDWLEDPQLDRSRVTPATAEVLRTRMNHCRYLVYASSRSSSTSRWMPWELGYFDGRRPGSVGILPVVGSSTDSFVGVEYLGLYPVLERFEFSYLGRSFGRRTSSTTADDLKSLARR